MARCQKKLMPLSLLSICVVLVQDRDLSREMFTQRLLEAMFLIPVDIFWSGLQHQVTQHPHTLRPLLFAFTGSACLNTWDARKLSHQSVREARRVLHSFSSRGLMVYSSLSCSLRRQARQFPLLWSWSNQETPPSFFFFVYFTCKMVWSRWRQGAASPPPPSPPPPFLFSIHPAPPVCASFACIVFEQCAVWTVRSWGNRRASSPPRLLSPASPSDAIKAYVSLKKGDAANRRQTSATSNMVPSHAHSISTERTDKARPKVCLTVYMYLRGVKSLIRTIPNTSTSFPHLERASLLVHTASKSIILKIPSCDASIKQWSDWK